MDSGPLLPQQPLEWMFQSQIQQQPTTEAPQVWMPQCAHEYMCPTDCMTPQPVNVGPAALSVTDNKNVAPALATHPKVTPQQFTKAPGSGQHPPDPIHPEINSLQLQTKNKPQMPKEPVATTVAANGKDGVPWIPLRPPVPPAPLDATVSTIPTATAHANADVEPDYTVEEPELLIFSDDDTRSSQHKSYVHKRRAGRTVRERRMYRQKRNGALVTQTLYRQHGGDFQDQDSTFFVRRGFSRIANLDWIGIFLFFLRFIICITMVWSIQRILNTLNARGQEPARDSSSYGAQDHG